MKLLLLLITLPGIALSVGVTGGKSENKEADAAKTILQLQGEIQQLKGQLDHVFSKLNVVDFAVGVVQTKMDDVAERVSENANDIANIAGRVYTRWGRTTCPVNSDRIYSGLMAAADKLNSGSGSNFLCLPHFPQYGNYANGSQTSYRAQISGTEYKGHPDDIFSHENMQGTTFVDQNVPCVTCETNGSSVLMLPARNTCPQGWGEEYRGYLAAQLHRGQAISTYECVDRAPEIAYDGSALESSAGLYNVEVLCPGVLPCPDYVHGWELTCVVCSK